MTFSAMLRLGTGQHNKKRYSMNKPIKVALIQYTVQKKWQDMEQRRKDLYTLFLNDSV
jgi:uncharacterized protein YdiU (UPF0061 family)